MLARMWYNWKSQTLLRMCGCETATSALENDLSVPKELNVMPNMLLLSSPRYLGEMKACVCTRTRTQMCTAAFFERIKSVHQ